MNFKANNVKSFSVKVTLVVLLNTSTYAFATQDESTIETYELTQRMLQHKRQLALNSADKEPLLVTPSSHGLDVTTFGNYDNFIITVSNQQGYTKQIENSYGSIDISELDLPYDGKYNYEMVAVKYTGEVIYDVMNNGRGTDASTYMTVTKTTSCAFAVSNGEIAVPEVLNEAKEQTLPVKPEQPESLPILRSFFGGE